MKKINLDEIAIYDSKTASLMWGMKKDYVRSIWNKYPDRFPKGSIRKFGKQLIVTKEGMDTLTGHEQMYKEDEVRFQ